jgi:hypothetical protein
MQLAAASSPRPPGLGPTATIAALLGVGLLAALMGAASSYVVLRAAPATPSTSVVTVKPAPNVLVSVRELARLETVTFHMERVIDLTDKQQHLFGLVESEDALLLVAAGDVTAGVDLSELLPGDITADPTTHTARVTLPPPKVFSSRLDSQRTYVHSRRTDALAKRKEGLETRARQEAEQRIGDAALEAGILEKAKPPAARTVEMLLRSLGFEQVTVAWR